MFCVTENRPQTGHLRVKFVMYFPPPTLNSLSAQLISSGFPIAVPTTEKNGFSSDGPKFFFVFLTVPPSPFRRERGPSGLIYCQVSVRPAFTNVSVAYLPIRIIYTLRTYYRLHIIVVRIIIPLRRLNGIVCTPVTAGRETLKF